MANTTTMGSKKFSIGKLIGICALGLFISFIAHFVLKYLYSFKFLNEDTDAPVFYTWRTKHADKHMVGPYEKVADNAWDTSDKELAEFIDFAQGSKNMLNDKGPEHFPRGSINYYTHSFKWNDDVFLPVRKYMVEETKRKNPSLYEKDDVRFLNLSDFQLSKIPSSSKFEELDQMHKVKDRLVELLNLLIKIKKEDKLTDDTDYEKNPIIGCTFDLLQEMNYEHTVWKGRKQINSTLTRKNVFDFYKNLAKASTSVFESFIYSRLFYIFYFYTTSLKLGGDDAKPKERFFLTSTLFAKIFVRAYKDPEDVKKLNAFAGFFKRFYSPKMSAPESVDIDLANRAIDIME